MHSIAQALLNIKLLKYIEQTTLTYYSFLLLSPTQFWIFNPSGIYLKDIVNKIVCQTKNFPFLFRQALDLT